MRSARDLPLSASIASRAFSTGFPLLRGNGRRMSMLDLVVQHSRWWVQNSVLRIAPRIEGVAPTRAAKNIQSP